MGRFAVCATSTVVVCRSLHHPSSLVVPSSFHDALVMIFHGCGASIGVVFVMPQPFGSVANTCPPHLPSRDLSATARDTNYGSHVHRTTSVLLSRLQRPSLIACSSSPLSEGGGKLNQFASSIDWPGQSGRGHSNTFLSCCHHCQLSRVKALCHIPSRGRPPPSPHGPDSILCAALPIASQDEHTIRLLSLGDTSDGVWKMLVGEVDFVHAAAGHALRLVKAK